MKNSKFNTNKTMDGKENMLLIERESVGISVTFPLAKET
jgi:hypothetical protein